MNWHKCTGFFQTLAARTRRDSAVRLRCADEFRDFVAAFSEKEFFNYAGGASPRTSPEKNVYNSTEYPPDLALKLHNELSYSRIFPCHLYFFCHIAPGTGGETTLGDSRRILQKIRPSIAALFSEKQVLYERNLSSEKGSAIRGRKGLKLTTKHGLKKSAAE